MMLNLTEWTLYVVVFALVTLQSAKFNLLLLLPKIPFQYHRFDFRVICSLQFNLVTVFKCMYFLPSVKKFTEREI